MDAATIALVLIAAFVLWYLLVSDKRDHFTSLKQVKKREDACRKRCGVYYEQCMGHYMPECSSPYCSALANNCVSKCLYDPEEAEPEPTKCVPWLAG